MASPEPSQCPATEARAAIRPRARKTLPFISEQGAEAEQQKGAGARAVKAVVGAQHQRRREHQRHLPPGLDLAPLLGQLPLPQHHRRHQGQQHQQQDFQHRLVHHELQPGAQGRAADGQHHRGDAEPPVHIAAVDIAPGGHGGADAGGELVGAQGQVGLQPRQQIAGHGDDPAASGDPVHKAGEKHAHHRDQHHPQAQLHGKQQRLHGKAPLCTILLPFYHRRQKRESLLRKKTKKAPARSQKERQGRR